MNHTDVRIVTARAVALSLRCVFVLCFLFLFGPVHSFDASAAEEKGSSAQRYVTIDFNDVDINLFIKYISELTGKNFVVDRAVKGKVTILSPTKISEDEAYNVFLSVLEVNGFTTVPSGSIVKIIPAVQARSKSIPTIRNENVLYPSDKVVTQIIQLTHSSPDDLKKILAPLVSKTSVLIAHAESGMLIITDIQSNIVRLQEIIEAVDIPSVGTELTLIPLQHASAASVAKAITQVFLQTARKGVKQQTIKILPYERTNSLIVFAPNEYLQKIRNLLVQLDADVPRGEGNIQVYYLQHANAEEMVKVLTNLPDQASTATTTKGKVTAPAISKDVKVMADAETNSLIIIAPREEYLVLEDVIKKLDIPRRMVYLEALIMEVDADKSFEIGVQWGSGGSFADGTGKAFGGFSGNDAAPYGILRGLESEPASLPAGFAFGLLKEGIKIGDLYFPDLGAVLRAYKDDSDVEIISTPQILTTDNKKATIKVGENVPYITSKNTTTTQQDYTNYEYKDVATTLEITPQVNQHDIVRLEIMTEIIKLKNPNDVSGTPATLTRKAETTVVVHNNETVVIGGIVGQDGSSSEYKVPLLGDIPVIGWLFKTRTEFEAKTNLFIFITPHIVENPAELAALYYQKRDVMENVKQGSSAIPDYKFRDKANPEHAMALSDLGFAKLQKEEYDLARQYFDQALKIDPNNPYALINMGVIYEHEGNTIDAEAVYRKVLSLAPDEHPGETSEMKQVDQSLLDIARENIKQLNLQLPLPDSATP